MPFPESVLNIKVEIMIDGLWNNITDYVYKEDIVIERGSADESSYSQPTQATFLLNNVDGRFSPRNPAGPYYGSLHRNQDVLISVEDGPTFLDCPALGGASTTGVTATAGMDLDVRVELQADTWSPPAINSGIVELCGQMEAGVGGWVFQWNNGWPFFYWSETYTSFTGTSSPTRPTIPPSGRMALRFTLDASSGEVNFYQAHSIDGEWVHLGTGTSGPGTLPANAAPLLLGDGLAGLGWSQFSGKIFSFSLADEIDGEPIADIDFSTVADGDTSFPDSTGNTWTTTGNGHVNNQWNRFRGQITAWPTKWTTGGFDAWTEIRAEGLARRFLQGDRALNSAMSRRIPSDPTVLAYWPMEEPAGATQFYSPIPDVLPMKFNDKVSPGEHAGPQGSSDLPSFDTGADWRGIVRGGTPAGWTIEFAVDHQQLTGTDHQFMRVNTSGSLRHWRIAADSTGVRILAFDEDDVEIIDHTVLIDVTTWLNIWTRVRLSAVQNGANIDWEITIIPIGFDGGHFSTSEAGQTCGRVTSVSGPNGGLHEEFAGISMGHIAVFSLAALADETTIFNQADYGFGGETARSRVIRLVEEEGEQIVVTGNWNDTVPMGAQRPDRFIDLLRECATADAGIFTDNRDAANWNAFKFIGRSGLENQPPAMTLDYEGEDGLIAPLDPTDDDLYLRNSVTMERERGSSFHVELPTGPLSVEEVGEYKGGETVNLETDEQLEDAAGWELHLGTWDEERYPTVQVLLQNAPHKLAEYLKVEQGSVIAITNARSEDRRTYIPPGDLRLMVRGYRETLSQFQWEVELQCVPARPWDVTVLEALNNEAERVDTDGCELTAAVDSDDTSLSLWTSGDQPTWTDSLEDYPFALSVGGEGMLAVGPGDVLTTNPFTETSVTDWTAVNSTVVWSDERVHPDPAATGSIKVTPDGTSATGGVRQTPSGPTGVHAGGRYKVGCWVWARNGLATFSVTVNWYTSGGAFISTPVTSTVAVPARTWTWAESEVTAPATADRVTARAIHAGTPAAADVYYIWGLRVSRASANAVQDDFTRSETDTWGTADTLQTWTNSGGAGSDYDVVSTYGRHIHTSVNVSRRSVITNALGDGDIVASMATAALSTGASQFAGVVQRHVDVDNLYEARAEFTTGNAVILAIIKRVAAAQTTLATFTSSITNVAAQYVRVRFQAEGSTLRAKIWLDGRKEPHTWHLVTTDSSLTTAGQVGVRSLRNTGNTNANADIRFGEFSMTNQQTMKVQRSHNGVVKSQTAGTAVELASPARLPI